MLFFGIYLHSNNSFIVVLHDDDKVLYARRHANSLEEICSALLKLTRLPQIKSAFRQFASLLLVDHVMN